MTARAAAESAERYQSTAKSSSARQIAPARPDDELAGPEGMPLNPEFVPLTEAEPQAVNQTSDNRNPAASRPERGDAI